VRWIDVEDGLERSADDLVIGRLAATVLTCPFGDDRCGVVHLTRKP
jgi:hypothetical protein